MTDATFSTDQACQARPRVHETLSGLARKDCEQCRGLGRTPSGFCPCAIRKTLDLQSWGFKVIVEDLGRK